jgi:hypothetical protein
MRIISGVLLLSGTGFLAGCAVLSSQPPIAPGQSVQLQPGDGIAALVMDTLDPVTQVLLVSTDGEGPTLDLPSMPAGRTLALFEVPTGVYCLKQFSYGEYRFISRKFQLGCFQVTTGHISYSGSIKPTAGRDPATGENGAIVDQAYEPAVFLALLKQQYPQVMAAYPTAGPVTGNGVEAQDDISKELATWSVEAADHRSFQVFMRNNANWPVKLTDFKMTGCTNIKQQCGDQPVGMTIQPNTTIKVMVVEQADIQQAYDFRYQYNYDKVDMGSQR